MTARTYNVPLDGAITVHVHDELVVVEAHLGGLASLIQSDPRAPHTEEQIEKDMELIQRLLMASPSNHDLRVVLRE